MVASFIVEKWGATLQASISTAILNAAGHYNEHIKKLQADSIRKAELRLRKQQIAGSSAPPTSKGTTSSSSQSKASKSTARATSASTSSSSRDISKPSVPKSSTKKRASRKKSTAEEAELPAKRRKAEASSSGTQASAPKSSTSRNPAEAVQQASGKQPAQATSSSAKAKTSRSTGTRLDSGDEAETLSIDHQDAAETPYLSGTERVGLASQLSSSSGNASALLVPAQVSGAELSTRSRGRQYIPRPALHQELVCPTCGEALRDDLCRSCAKPGLLEGLCYMCDRKVPEACIAEQRLGMHTICRICCDRMLGAAILDTVLRNVANGCQPTCVGYVRGCL